MIPIGMLRSGERAGAASDIPIDSGTLPAALLTDNVWSIIWSPGTIPPSSSVAIFGVFHLQVTTPFHTGIVSVDALIARDGINPAVVVSESITDGSSMFQFQSRVRAVANGYVLEVRQREGTFFSNIERAVTILPNPPL